MCRFVLGSPSRELDNLLHGISNAFSFASKALQGIAGATSGLSVSAGLTALKRCSTVVPVQTTPAISAGVLAALNTTQPEWREIEHGFYLELTR